MAETIASETHGFQTEVRQLLKLMIHSLYSNKEIFLRELISNASDAADKLRFEALANPELTADGAELGIRVEIDKDANTVAVIDNGIGMSRDEIHRNLGTIAKSGTAEFLQQLGKDAKADAHLIGQFGVGFYSAFIVADRVVVESRRAGLPAEEAVRWSSDGDGEFTLENIERSERGTRVVLHLKKAENEFADALRIETLIRRYSDHIAFPVELVDGDAEPRLVNSATALWTRPRSEVNEDEYKEFYKHLAHDFSDPVCWSHNKVEGKREYTSLLYIPAKAPFDLWNREAPRGVKLYVQRVFIMDDAEQFLPLYLRFVRGVVDCADLPLNVSRELLQQNPALGAMRSALTKRVLDMLKKLAADDPERYQSVWQEFGNVLKEGLVEDAPNKDKIAALLRFASSAKDSDEQSVSLADYVSRMQDGQQHIYYLLADSHAAAAASPHLERLRAGGFEVLLLSDPIDAWVVEHLDEYDGKALADVARDDLELPDADASTPEDAGDDGHEPLLTRLRTALEARAESVRVSRRLVDSPACVVAAASDMSPQLRRMLEASGQKLPKSLPILEINVEHPLVAKLAAESDGERFDALAHVLLDHAQLAEGRRPDDPAAYVRRMNSLLLELAGGAESA